MVLTYKQRFNKKYGFKLEEPHNKKEISQITGIPMSYLDESAKRASGAWKNNLASVRLKSGKKDPTAPRSAKMTEDQWIMSRIYSMVMDGKADPDLREKFKKLKRYKEKST